MTAYLFAGQGSQYVGMGKDLYESFPASRSVFEKADRVLGFSLSRLCFEGPQDELTLTHNCQPAILTVSLACLEAFKSTAEYDPSAVRYAAGLSLGEYSALVAASAISFEDAVYLVRRRGEFMEEEAAKNPGKMLSLLGLELDKVRDVCHNTNTEIANINCPGQIVISGSKEGIEAAEKEAKDLGVRRAVALEVSGAFHSSFMRGASLKLEQELSRVRINEPRIPVISNVTAQEAVSIEQIKDNLVQQVARSVLWEDSMKFIISCGVNIFIEFGPGKVLKGLMRRINEKVEVKNIEKKEDVAEVKYEA